MNKIIVPVELLQPEIRQHFFHYVKFVVVIDGYAQAGFSRRNIAKAYVPKYVTSQHDNMKVDFVEISWMHKNERHTEVMTTHELMEFKADMHKDTKILVVRKHDGTGYDI